MIWFQCSPVDALWDPLRQSHCDHRKSVYYTYFVGAVAAFSDFYMAIVPINMFMPLHIDRKLKWGLCFLMGCGVFAGVAAIIRTWAAKYILTQDSSCKTLPTSPIRFLAATRSLNTQSNIVDGVAVLFLWGEVEEWIVLITMCIPPVWPIFRPFVQRFIQTSASRSQQRNYRLPYGTTPQDTQPSSGVWPPRVTTTISVSSATAAAANSSDSILGHGNNQGEVPGNVLHKKGLQGAWVELPDLEKHPGRQ